MGGQECVPLMGVALQRSAPRWHVRLLHAATACGTCVDAADWLHAVPLVMPVCALQFKLRQVIEREVDELKQLQERPYKKWVQGSACATTLALLVACTSCAHGLTRGPLCPPGQPHVCPPLASSRPCSYLTPSCSVDAFPSLLFSQPQCPHCTCPTMSPFSITHVRRRSTLVDYHVLPVPCPAGSSATPA